MDKIVLVQYLEGQITALEFSNSLNDEIIDYKNALKKKGSSVSIKFNNDLSRLFISQAYFNRINLDFLNENLDKYTLSYIADCLLLSENSEFENEDLVDQFESICIG